MSAWIIQPFPKGGQMKSAVMDIETTSLSGVGGGILLCVCVRPLQTQRTRTYHIGQYHYDPSPEHGFFERQERDLLQAISDEMGKYDLFIGHNIDKFDLDFLRTRAYRNNMPWFHTPFTYDTMRAFGRTGYRTVLNSFGKPSKSMAMVADFLGLDQLKTAIYPVEWWSSVWGNDKQRAEALKNITDHCERDVRSNARMYELLLKADPKAIIRRHL
jgi:uncharacterized protein YprB with RNaseH-like and TPR domain